LTTIDTGGGGGTKRRGSNRSLTKQGGGVQKNEGLWKMKKMSIKKEGWDNATGRLSGVGGRGTGTRLEKKKEKEAEINHK